MPVIIDPRRHDAVLFGLHAPIPDTLVRQLHRAGVRTAALDSDRAQDVRPARAVVVVDTAAGVATARNSGFALVIGVDEPDADVTVTGLDEVGVRTGDRPMPALPDAMELLGDSTLATSRPAAFFDYDGTLSDIVADPDSAGLVAGAGEALRALATHCPVAVLSGRDLADVQQRIGLPGIWYAGSHGFESTAPDGSHHQNDTAAAAVPVLADAAAELAAQLGNIAGVAVEHKRFAVAVHYRNAARERIPEVTAAVRGAGRRYALRVTTGREVIELRPDVDWDKGKTLRWILARLGGELLPIYLGDDITDEDAFDAVAGDGVGIVVRHSDDGDRPTAARFALDSPADVSAFTAALARRLGADRAV